MNSVIVLYLLYKENIIKKTVDAANANGQAIEQVPSREVSWFNKNNPPSLSSLRVDYFFLSLDSSV